MIQTPSSPGCTKQIGATLQTSHHLSDLNLMDSVCDVILQDTERNAKMVNIYSDRYTMNPTSAQLLSMTGSCYPAQGKAPVAQDVAGSLAWSN